MSRAGGGRAWWAMPILVWTAGCGSLFSTRISDDPALDIPPLATARYVLETMSVDLAREGIAAVCVGSALAFERDLPDDPRLVAWESRLMDQLPRGPTPLVWSGECVRRNGLFEVRDTGARAALLEVAPMDPWSPRYSSASLRLVEGDGGVMRFGLSIRIRYSRDPDGWSVDEVNCFASPEPCSRVRARPPPAHIPARPDTARS